MFQVVLCLTGGVRRSMARRWSCALVDTRRTAWLAWTVRPQVWFTTRTVCSPVRAHDMWLSRSCATLTDRQKAVHFVLDRGYSRELAEAIINTLAEPRSGIPHGTLLPTVTNLAGRWEVGEDAGLDALAQSVRQELARVAGKRRVRFTVYPPRGGAPFQCEAFEGMSLKDVAQHGVGSGAQTLAECLECSCSGVMACSTCHVYVGPEWLGLVGAPSEAELDMIELAHEPNDSSRLGCQLSLTADLEGLTLTIPDGANNMFDSIPFQ